MFLFLSISYVFFTVTANYVDLGSPYMCSTPSRDWRPIAFGVSAEECWNLCLQDTSCMSIEWWEGSSTCNRCFELETEDTIVLYLETSDLGYPPHVFVPWFSGYVKVFENSISELSQFGNFHPQDLAYDEYLNQLVACPQASKAIYLINPDTLEIEEIISHNLEHSTGVAVDANYYYITDYTGNNGYMHRCSKATRLCEQVAPIAGYGGVPITVSESTLYRAALDSSGSGSNGYDWGNLNTLVTSSVHDPSNVQSSCSLSDGADSLAYADNDQLLQMTWNGDTGLAEPTIKLVDVNTCDVLDSKLFGDACGSDLNAAGVAYKPGTIWIYCWGLPWSTTSKIVKYNNPCTVGCDNVCGSTAVVDECGVCGGSGIAPWACDCAGNTDQGCGCGLPGPGCDNICGSTTAEDECGVCGGSGIAPGACDCAGNVDQGCGCGLPGPSGCDNLCGSTAVDQGCGCGLPGPSGCDNLCGSITVEDECGVCGGSGIAPGACDCDGNTDEGCGCGLPGPSGCDNLCGSTAVIDECGICGGPGIAPGACDCSGNVNEGCGCGAGTSCTGTGTYSEYFPSGGVSSSSSQCSNFNSFVDDGPESVTQLTLTAATGTFTCTDSTVVNDIWSHLQSSSNPSEQTFSCDGNQWLVGYCGNGREIAAGATVGGECACGGDDIVLRPCINNGNWGGGNGGCSQSSQTMELTWISQTCGSIVADDSGVCGVNAAYDSNFSSDICAGPVCGSIDESTCCSCVCSPETDATAAPSGGSCGEFVDRSDSKITGNIVDMRIAFPYYFEGETIRADDDSVIPDWTIDETSMCTHELSKDFFYEDLRDDVGFTLDAFVLYFHLNFAYNFQYEEIIEIGGVSYTWPASTLERALDLTFSIDVPKSRSISVGFDGTDSLGLIVQTFQPTRNPTSQPSMFPTDNPTKEPTANPTMNPTSVPSMNPTSTPTLHPTNPDVEIYSTILEYASQEVYDFDDSTNVRIILTITTITNMPWMLELVSLSGGGILNEDFNQQAVSDCPPGLDLVAFCQTWNIEFDSPPGCDSSAREVELNFDAVAPGGSAGTGEVRVAKAPITINLGSTSSWICVQNLGQFALTYDVESSLDGSNWVTAPNHEPLVGTFWNLRLSFASDTSDLGVGFVSRFDVSDDLHGPKCTDCHQDAELQFTVVEDGHQAFEIRFFLTPLYFANAMTHFEIEISFPDTTPLAAGRRLLNQDNESEVVGMVISLMVGEGPGLDMPTFTATPTLEPSLSPTFNPTEAPVEQACVDLKSGHQSETCATYTASLRMRGEKCEIPALWDNCCASCSALENGECTDNVVTEQGCLALYNAYFPANKECDNPLMFVHCCATCEALSREALQRT